MSGTVAFEFMDFINQDYVRQICSLFWRPINFFFLISWSINVLKHHVTAILKHFILGKFSLSAAIIDPQSNSKRDDSFRNCCRYADICNQYSNLNRSWTFDNNTPFLYQIRPEVRYFCPWGSFVVVLTLFFVNWPAPGFHRLTSIQKKNLFLMLWFFQFKKLFILSIGMKTSPYNYLFFFFSKNRTRVDRKFNVWFVKIINRFS